MSKDNNYIYNKNNHDYAEALKVIFDIKLEAFILQQKEIIKENTKIHLEELKKRNIYFILRKIQAEEDKLVEEIEEFTRINEPTLSLIYFYSKKEYGFLGIINRLDTVYPGLRRTEDMINMKTKILQYIRELIENEIEEYVKLRRYLIISKAKINSVIIIIVICIIAIANILQ